MEGSRINQLRMNEWDDGINPPRIGAMEVTVSGWKSTHRETTSFGQSVSGVREP
jgi:hypothetical protein